MRKPPKRVDYLLRHNRDFPIAVVEAKASYKTAADAVQQARYYAEMLGLKFACATNGTDIIEIDYFTGCETRVPTFPTPDELWQRYQVGAGLTSSFPGFAAPRAVQPRRRQDPALLSADRYQPHHRSDIERQEARTAHHGYRHRQTTVSFQICWKLWSTRWNRTGEHRKPRILFLADRNILIDDPKDKTFAPFGVAGLVGIEGGVVSGVINLESSGVEASDWRPRHDEQYHEA